jgi:hypothetical protein
MKKTFRLVGRLCLPIALLILSCKTEPPSPWDNFTKCAANACVKEVVAVKDAFLADPAALFAKFDEAGQKGEDHFIGWLYILRDSVLLNPAYGATEARLAMQQQLVETATKFENDPKYGGLAKSIADEIGMLAIAAELEDEPADYAPVTGVYAYELPNDDGTGELKVSLTGSDSIRFDLLVVGGPPAHNQGAMQGAAVRTGMNTFEATTTEFQGTCKLRFTFDGEAVEIKTLEGDAAACGFGNGISADYVYRMTTYDDPFLPAPDAKTANNLRGAWVSATDAKFELNIESGKYTELQGGEKISSLPYQFYPKCPAECNPLAPTPCISVMGQDVLCYTVVKADGKSLELSLIGGTGNTLIFRKK